MASHIPVGSHIIRPCPYKEGACVREECITTQDEPDCVAYKEGFADAWVRAEAANNITGPDGIKSLQESIALIASDLGIDEKIYIKAVDDRVIEIREERGMGPRRINPPTE